MQFNRKIDRENGAQIHNELLLGYLKKKKSRTVKCHWEMKGLERIK